MNYSSEYKAYIASKRWRDIRQAKLRKVGYKCEKCGERHNLQVHHRHYDQEFGKERAQDLIVVCNTCHNNLHH